MMSKPETRILLAEDDENLGGLLSNYLSKKNWMSSKDSKVFLTGDWVLGKSLSDAWNAGLKLSHYLKILDI